MFKGIILSQVFLNTADAVAVGSDCPNDNWQASYDYTTGQVEVVDGETICEPKQSAFQISCSPTGIQVDLNYGLLYDTYDVETIAASLPLIHLVLEIAEVNQNNNQNPNHNLIIHFHLITIKLMKMENSALLM